MGGIAAALAFEIDRRIAATPGRITGWRDIVFPLKTFVARPRLEQRPVHGEVLIRQQLRGVGLKQHRLEERRRDIAIEQPISILRERGRRPDAVVHPQAHEPAEQNVEVQLLHQLPLTPDAVERLQQQGPQQLLRGDRGPAELDIQHVELGRQSGQRPIGHPANRSQRMIRRHTFLRRDVAEHRSWLLIGSTHRSPPFRWEDGSTNESPRGTYFFSSLLKSLAPPHSRRSVSIGSRRVARRSGRHAPAAAVTKTTTQTIPYVAGSAAATPNRSALKPCADTAAPSTPSAIAATISLTSGAPNHWRMWLVRAPSASRMPISRACS